MKKRVLSFLLTLCLIVVLFPAAALAADAAAFIAAAWAVRVFFP